MKTLAAFAIAFSLLFAFAAGPATEKADAVSVQKVAPEGTAVAAWWPGKFWVNRRQRARARGGWYLGKRASNWYPGRFWSGSGAFSGRLRVNQYGRNCN